MELAVYEPIICCRYCLSDDNNSDLVSPCRCDGTTKYVHKKCLNEWFAKKNNRIIIPGAFHQFEHACEICHTPYKITFKKINSTRKLYLDVFVYIFVVTTLLISAYIGIGWSLEQSEKTRQLFIQRGNNWENIFCNGFLMTHITLAIFYIVMAITNNISDNICFCYWFYNGDCGEDFCICILFLVIIGILGTILVIYYDIITRVVQRYQNQCRVITDIDPYVSQI